MLVKAVRPLLLAGAKVTSQQERAMGFRLARIPYRLTSRTLKASPILMRGGPSQDDLDNHANQCNPNNDAYWDSRGYEDGRPEDWEDTVHGDDDNDVPSQADLDNHANQCNPNNDAYHQSREASDD